MRKWWTDEMKDRWRQAREGDLVYLVGSTSQRCGEPGIVTMVYPAPHTRGVASVLWQNGSIETSRCVEDLEVVSESA